MENEYKTPKQRVGYEIENMERIVTLYGSAKRKSQKLDYPRIEPIQNPEVPRKTLYQGNFSDLRIPLRVRRFKKKQETNHDLITRQCKILFDCLKPYQDIIEERRVRLTCSYSETKENVSSNDCKLKRMAARKMQFFSFCEETPTSSFGSQPFFTGCNFMSSYEYKEVPSDGNTNFFNFNFPKRMDTANVTRDVDVNSASNKRIISSEDFVNTVLSGVVDRNLPQSK